MNKIKPLVTFIFSNFGPLVCRIAESDLEINGKVETFSFATKDKFIV